MIAQKRGSYGEKITEKHYKSLGYRIEKRNFTTRLGEIDLIVCKKDVLVFVEVKTRGENAIGLPRDWVTYTKQRKIINTAKLYLQRRGSDDFAIRFDVAEVILSSTGAHSLTCIENAFTL